MCYCAACATRIIRLLIPLALIMCLWSPPGRATTELDNTPISEIEIKGNVNASDKSIRKLMATRRSSWYRRRRFKRKVFERDLQAILISYQNSGYLSAAIEESRLEVSPADTTLRIVIRLSEGPRYNVRHLILDGNAKLEKALLLQQLILREGQPFQRLHLDDDMARLQIVYAEHGMVDARIEQHVDLDHNAAGADIAYTISEGEIVHIGLVTVEGIRRVRRKTIERELTFSRGARYDHLKTIQSQANLFRTGLFSQVNIALEETSPGARVRDVLVRVEERKTGEVNFGVGYGTLDRARLGLKAVQKCFAGSGVGVAFEGKIGKYERRACASMTAQWVLRWRVGTDAQGFYGYEDQPAYRVEEFGVQLDLRRQVAARTGLSGGASVTRTTLLEGDIPQRRGRTNAVRAEWVRDSRDDVLSPVRGSLHRIRVEWAGGPLGADYAFLKAQGNASHFLQFSRQWVVGTSIRFGRISSLRRGETPVHEKFFAGGAGSIRGFPTGSIGAHPQSSGGMVLLCAQNELRFPLWPSKKIGGTLLADLGQTWRRNREVTARSLEVGVGGGFRVGLPFGLVRFDLALPAETRVTWKRLQFYAGIGQGF